MANSFAIKIDERPWQKSDTYVIDCSYAMNETVIFVLYAFKVTDG